VVWRTPDRIATQTQTTSQHYRPICFHECLDRKAKQLLLKLFLCLK
jgi:hypothetical protein